MTNELPLAFTETSPPVRSVTLPVGSADVTMLALMVGLTTPVIWPLPSTATDCLMSNSMRRPARPLLVTILAVGKLTVTVVCVGEPVVGLKVPFSVVMAAA